MVIETSNRSVIIGSFFDQLRAAKTQCVIKPITQLGGCNLDRGRSKKLITLMVVLVLVFGGGAGYYSFGSRSLWSP